MRFKTEHEYPDAEVDDAPETEAHAQAMPTSDARQRLAKLLAERSEANGEMQAARSSIAKLTATQSLAAPFEQQLAMLCAADGEAMRLWSDAADDAAMPLPDVAAREALQAKISQAKASSAAAQSAIPALEQSYSRASNKTLGLTWCINAAISEILLEEIEPCFAAIVEAKASLAAAIGRAERGRDIALRGVEAIPAERRFAVAPGFYSVLEGVDRTRTLAISNPPPSHDPGPWAEFSRRLAVDHLAVSGHQAEG
jgi:hypothetical protein